MNLAAEYLKRHGETVEDWDGCCGSLADKLIGPNDSIIYVEGPAIKWRYHMVPLIDGLVHDAWCEGDALPLPEWLSKMFGEEWVEVSENGDTFYEGPASAFNQTEKGQSQGGPDAAGAGTVHARELAGGY